MWMLKNTPALCTDLYELTMAQVYFHRSHNQTANFEVKIRRLPKDWGFFVMAGLEEIHELLNQFKFDKDDIAYLNSLNLFTDEFLDYLKNLKLNVNIRSFKEGTIFFPQEPVLEVTGPVIHTQLLETIILNILCFSITSASHAARLAIASKGKNIVDFGLRRAQGPVSAFRSVRGIMIADLSGTSNLMAARKLNYTPVGTMAHSFIQSYDSEEQAFREFAERYKEKTILLVDTYDSKEGIKKAAGIAKEFLKRNIRINGIRLDSGHIVELAFFARHYFDNNNLEFLKIFASGNMDEYKIKDMLDKETPIDGFGIGSNLSVSEKVPCVDIVYKMVRYGQRDVCKKSPMKEITAGRKSVIRVAQEGFYYKDIVQPFKEQENDLLQSFTTPENISAIQNRLKYQLANIRPDIKKLQNSGSYIVEYNS